MTDYSLQEQVSVSAFLLDHHISHSWENERVTVADADVPLLEGFFDQWLDETDVEDVSRDEVPQADWDELVAVEQARRRGYLTQEQFDLEKARLLGSREKGSAR